MAIFNFSKGKEEPASPELVLAYLEEAMRVRSPFIVRNDKGQESSALVHSVNEEARSFRLLPKDHLPVAKGGKVAFTFIHDGLRIGGASRALEAARPGVLALQLPDLLELMERRRHPRVRLNPKEQASLTALQDLFEGAGITGALENVSEGGARVRVEKAVAIGSEKRLVLGTNLVPAGQKFMVVKLNKVPRCPAAMEVEGKAAYLVHEPAGLFLGLGFGKLSGPVETALRGLAAQRCPPVPATLPPKLRRRPEGRDGEAPDGPAAGDAPGPEAASAVTGDAGTVQESAVPAAGQAGTADPAERRHTPRLTLGAGFRARFMAGDTLITEADLLDLSAGGCCLRLPLDRCQEVRQGVDLDEFHFLHPDLPRGVLRGRVKWVMGRNPEALASAVPGRYCLVGVEFRDPPEPVSRALAVYVARHLP